MRFKNRRYGAWAGNKDGNAYNPKRCAAEVSDGFRFYQCARKPVAGPDNLYCRQHAKLIADNRLFSEQRELKETEARTQDGHEKVDLVGFTSTWIAVEKETEARTQDGHEKSELAVFVMAIAAAALIAVITYYVVGFMPTWIAAEDEVPLAVTSGELFAGNEFTPSGVAVPIYIDPKVPVIYGDIQFDSFETFVVWITMTDYERRHGRTRREGP